MKHHEDYIAVYCRVIADEDLPIADVIKHMWIHLAQLITRLHNLISEFTGLLYSVRIYLF